MRPKKPTSKAIDDQLTTDQIAEILKERRTQLGATRQLVAECSCSNKTSYGQIESGKMRHVRLGVILQILEALGMEMLAGKRVIRKPSDFIRIVSDSFAKMTHLDELIEFKANWTLGTWKRGEVAPSITIALRYLGKLGIRVSIRRKSKKAPD